MKGSDTTKRWRVRINPFTALIPGHIVEVDDRNGTPICIVHESENNWRRNTPTRADIAMLIGTAPLLLKALKDLVQQEERYVAETQMKWSDPITKAVKKARVVIAKAEGNHTPRTRKPSTKNKAR